jgi:hypothetical protein
MAARDMIHYAVKNALIKDGWTILADPYQIRYEDKILAADLRAERLLRLVRQHESIVVEIKSFVGHSFIKELQEALGQYQMYAFFLEALGEEDSIFLAVSEAVFEEEFQSAAVQKLVAHFHLRLLVVDIQNEEVVKWMK